MLFADSRVGSRNVLRSDLGHLPSIPTTEMDRQPIAVTFPALSVRLCVQVKIGRHQVPKRHLAPRFFALLDGVFPTSDRGLDLDRLLSSKEHTQIRKLSNRNPTRPTV